MSDDIVDVRTDPPPKLMCEARVGWRQNDAGGFEPEFCNKRNTIEYTDIWGGVHAVCEENEACQRAVKAIYPGVIQRSLYEDVKKQDSLLPHGSIGGSLRPGVPVFDDSDYRLSTTRRKEAERRAEGLD